MSPVPAACQALADQVGALEQAYGDQSAQASKLTGAPAWTALGQLGPLRAALTEARANLDQCVTTHSAALTGTVVVIDAGAGAGADAQTATLWDLAAGGPVARETSPVQAFAFGFQGPLPAQAAITIQTAGQPDVTGVDFRSGPLQAPLAGQTPRLEMVLGPKLTVPAAVLAQALAGFAASGPLTAGGDGPAGVALPITVAVSGLAVALGAGSLTLTANGTLTGSFGGLDLEKTPFSVTASLSVIPSTAADGTTIADVTPAGSSPVEASVPAIPGVGAIVGLLSSHVATLVQPALSNALHQALPGQIAKGLALASLPPNTTVSLRSVSIDPTGISFQPALGTVGTALSTYQPAPLPPP